jgi:(p)ppGpp synthase/HD superfamily hydrolase
MTDLNAPKTPTLEDAIILAATHHRGQTDKAGEPYVLHPLRLMLSLRDPHERLAALLHDIVEDTDITLDDLRALGYPTPVVAAIELLTHTDGSPYLDYVARLKTNPIARAVKLADLADNMNLDRIAQPTAKDRVRIQRYQAARELLLA